MKTKKARKNRKWIGLISALLLMFFVGAFQNCTKSGGLVIGSGGNGQSCYTNPALCSGGTPTPTPSGFQVFQNTLCKDCTATGCTTINYPYTGLLTIADNNVNGASSSVFTTDVSITNSDPANILAVQVAYYQNGQTGTPSATCIIMQPLSTATFSNAVNTLFGSAAGTNNFGVLHFVVNTTATTPQIMFNAYDVSHGSASGPMVSGIPQTMLSKNGQILNPMTNQGTAPGPGTTRSNILIVNPCTTGGGSSTFTLTPASGGTAQTFTLAPFQMQNVSVSSLSTTQNVSVTAQETGGPCGTYFFALGSNVTNDNSHTVLVPPQ